MSKAKPRKAKQCNAQLSEDLLFAWVCLVIVLAIAFCSVGGIR